MIPKVPQPSTTTCCSTSNHMVGMPRSNNLVANEDGASRGVKKEKYPLDDYLLMDKNTQTRTQASLLSPISPVSSPETVNALQNAERLVKSAQKQIMEVSFNSALDTLDENPLSYIGQQPLEDSLLYVREMVDSKFQESNDPNGIHIRKTSSNNVANLNRKFQHDQFPVKESSGMINRPLEISAQNSEFSTSQNEKRFFKKAPNWFNIKPPDHITVYPTSTTNNLERSKAKNSCTVPRCTMTNTGVIEIDGRDRLNGTIQVQTGPRVDIRGGLTIQTIENVHISPDPSSVPIYNNVATYCFQHEPSTSTSYADSNRNNSITSSTARNIFDSRKERHIQSTDYNDMHKTTVHIENTHNAVIKDSNNSSHDTIGTQAVLTNNSNNQTNRDEIDLNIIRNRKTSDNNVVEHSNLHKSSISNDAHLREHRTLRESVDNVSHLKKAVSINLTPIVTSVYQEIPVADIEIESENKEKDFEGESLPKIYYEISPNTEFTGPYGGEKFRHVRSDKDYIERLHVCGDDCKTGACSRNCERDVEYREKKKLKQTLETIANIEKIRFDMKDTGIHPTECTQICENKNHCNADMVRLEFEPLSDPERFKTALEDLCKFSQKSKASKIDTDSKLCQEAIDVFVKMVFDSNSQTDLINGLYSSDENLENEVTASRQNRQSVEGNGSVEKAEVETRRQEDVAKALKQVKLIPEAKEMGYRRQSNNIVRPKINDAAVNILSNRRKNTSDGPIQQFCAGRTEEQNKYSKPRATQNSQLPKDNAVSQCEKVPTEMLPNGKENSVENLDLKQPCVSDVDAVLKTYRESMAAISRGTEQLSQLISHHIMRNTLTTNPDQISSLPNPNCSVTLGETDFRTRITDKEKPEVTPIMNSVSHDSSKRLEHVSPIYKEKTTDKTSIQTTCPNQNQSTVVIQQKYGRDRISQRLDTNVSKDNAELSNENNSIFTNETPVSTTNESSSICSRTPSERAKTLSNTDEKSSPVQFDATNDQSSSTPTSKALQQTPVNVRTQSVPTQRRVMRNVRKPDEKQFMNIQYCIAEPFEAPIPIEGKSDKNNSSSKSDLKRPLSTYLHLENACGKDMRLRRHSNYDIHNDRAEDFDSYERPVLISGQRDNSDALNNDSNDNFLAADNVIQNKETEIPIFGQILDAVKNSSQFMNRVIFSLFNGIEIDSINDIIRNLEEAAVHPIVIEQFLILLKQRNTDKSLFGGNIMPPNSVPGHNDWQKNYNELTDLPKTNDETKHSLGLNGTMETRNVDNIKTDLDPSASHIAGEQITGSSHPTQKEMNLSFEFNEDRAHPIHDRNSPDEETLENELPRDRQVERKIILGENIEEKELKDDDNNSTISETTFDNKSRLLKPSVTTPATENAIQLKSKQDCQEAKEKSLVTEYCQNNDDTSKRENSGNECSMNSVSLHVTPKKNDSESNTEKDISFIIPHDAEMNNEVVDLSSMKKLTSVTLKNETTGDIIGFQIESNCQNSLRLNSLTQEKSAKINSNTDPGKSSIATNKSNAKSGNSNEPTSNHARLIKNLEKDDQNIICHCRRPSDQNDPNIQSHHIPCDSSLNAVNAVMDSQIRSSYKQLGLLDTEGRTFRPPDKTARERNERTLDRRPGPHQLSSTSKSPARKGNHSSRSDGKRKISFDKKVSGNKKAFSDNKQGLGKNVKNRENGDPEKSDSKNACPLCIELEGKCSCMDCTDCNVESKRQKKVPPKLKKEREKLVKNVTSPRQSPSPKRTGNASKYPLRKELSSRRTPMPLDSGKNADSKDIDCSQGIVKNDKKCIGAGTVKDGALIERKSKSKPSSGLSSSDSNNNNASMNGRIKPRRDKKLFQDAASDSDNLKVENKSQNTANYGDFAASCKSTGKQDTVISDKITVCKSSAALCRNITIPDERSLFLPRKLDKIVETKSSIEPPVKDAGTLPYFQSSSSVRKSPSDYRNSYCQKMTSTKEKITGSKDMKDFSTMGCQTSGICDDNKTRESKSPETTTETGTISLFKTACEKIFDDESIVVLQPLNESDHTFFIAKPNCLERKIIQEKLDKRFNIRAREMTDRACPSIRELDRDHKEETKKELPYSNCEINVVHHEECQTGCDGGTEAKNLINEQTNADFAPTYVTDSSFGILENKQECAAHLCANNDACSRMCSHPTPESNDLSFHCKEDCPQDEICLELCSSIPEAEPLVQISSININGVLKKFVAENNLPNVKLPIVKDLLQELKKVEDSLRAENERFGTIYEKSGPQNDDDKTGMKDTVCDPEGSHRKSVQYEEPHDKMKHIMRNRKSLVLPNVVRGLADMHPSKKLENLKLRSADPLVSGNFNKPNSDKRYSVFNQSDPTCSSIDLNDPRTQKHLASVAQWAKVHEGEKSSSDSSVDIIQSTVTKINKNKKPPTTGKSDNKNSSKLNKSKRGMDADSNFFKRLDEISIDSMKSFESSDLEPGEFLQVRTPFDNPRKSCQSRERINSKLGEVPQDQAICNNLCTDYKTYSRSVRDIEGGNILEKTQNRYKTLENQYELCMDSARTVYRGKQHKIHNDEVVDKPEAVSPDIVKPIANGSKKIIVKSNPGFGISDHDSGCDGAGGSRYTAIDNSQSKNQSHNEKNSKAKNSVLSISKSGSNDVKSNALNSIGRRTATKILKSLKINDCHGSKVEIDSHEIINENQKINPLKKYSGQFPNDTECSSRPEIIDHFLGKTKLEDMKMDDYKNNQTNQTSKECENGGSNRQRLWAKSDFISETNPDSENSNILETRDLSMPRNDPTQVNFISRTYTERDFANFNHSTNKRWDQTSSDTYSEGEINPPSSCSYSLGEVKLSTHSSSTTAGKSFKDPDGFTIFVTNSILDSAHPTRTSPGEILADIQKIETDVSSSIS